MARRSANSQSCGLFVLFVVVMCLAAGLAYRNAGHPRGLLAKLDCCSAVIDLPSGGFRVEPVLARTEQDETFAALIARVRPYAAITGTFYGPEHTPLGDIVADGKLACRGFQRQGIGFTSSGEIRFVERHGSSRIDWRGCCAGVACGPRLLRNGKIDINVRRDGFTSLAARIEATRCAVGATKDGKLVILAIREPVTLRTLARAMLELNAVDAINMDGGALCGFYSEGVCRAVPVKPVSNVIAVYRMK